jgi:hypothetical protein
MTANPTSAEPLTISGKDMKTLHKILLDLFRRADLEQLLLFEMDVRLFADVTSDLKSFSDMVSDLIKWLNQYERVWEFLAAALAARPQNQPLREFADRVRNRSAGPFSQTPGLSLSNREYLLAEMSLLIADRRRDAPDLEIFLRPEDAAIERPWHRMIEHDSGPRAPLPPCTRLISVFDESRGALLILGEPGSGKTFAMLEVAQEVLRRARRDPEQPIPVVLSLATWARKAMPLAEWLAAEVRRNYSLSLDTAQRWLEENRLVLFLDSLDEVSEDRREACLKAINDFHSDHGPTGMVVCSRADEYQALRDRGLRLQLRSAIWLEPLTAQQVQDYLAGAEDSLAGLHAAVFADPTLMELAKTPLMLQILRLTYSGTTVPERPRVSADELRNQIWVDYVKRMLERPRLIRRQFPSERLIWSLTWLARRMKQDSLSAFALDQLSPRWLRAGRELYTFVVVLLTLVVVLGVPIAATIAGTRLVRPGQAPVFLGAALVLGMVVIGPFARADIDTLDVVSWSLKRARVFLLGMAWLFGLMWLMWSPFSLNTLSGWSVGTAVGAFGALVVVAWRALKASSLRLLLFPSQNLYLPGALFAGTLVGFLIVRPLINLVVNLGTEGYLDRLKEHTLFLFWPFVPIALVIIFYGGFERKKLASRLVVNGGIKRSLKNAFITVLVSLLPAGILLLSQRTVRAEAGTGSWLDGVTIGVGMVLALTGLYFGGFVVIKHYALRTMLAWQGYLPFDCPRLLDEGAQRILLRKVRDEYIFVHQLLLEHFAVRAGEGEPETMIGVTSVGSPGEEWADRLPPRDSAGGLFRAIELLATRARGGQPAAPREENAVGEHGEPSKLRLLPSGPLEVALRWLVASLLSAAAGGMLAVVGYALVLANLRRPEVALFCLEAGVVVGAFFQVRRRTLAPLWLIGGVVAGIILGAFVVLVLSGGSMETEARWFAEIGISGISLGFVTPVLLALFQRVRKTR